MTLSLTALQAEVLYLTTKGTGPGGQNVNKRNTTALLVWRPESSNLFTEVQKARLKQRLNRHLNQEGEVTIKSGESRSLEQNKKVCLLKLEHLIVQSFKEKKKRIKTKPSRASKEKRHRSKKLKSDRKKSRQRVSSND